MLLTWIKKPFQALADYWNTPDPMMLRQASVLAVAALLATLASWGGLKTYREVKLHYYLHLVEKSLAAGDTDTAQNFLRLARINRPAHPRVLRLIVQLASDVHSPYYLYWLRHLAAAQPNDPTTQLELARAFVKAGKPSRACEIARDLIQKNQRPADAENILGIIAHENGHFADAGRHFHRALELEPTSAPFLANLLAFLLSQPGRDRDTEIESLIARMESLPGGETSAARQRIVFLQSRNRSTEALHVSEKIIRTESHRIGDWIRHLNLVALYRPKQFPQAREEAVTRALKSPEDCHQLLAWLVSQGAFADAQFLLDRLPGKAAFKPPFLIEAAEIARKAQQWDRLRLILDQGNWQKQESLRLVYAAEVAAAENKPDETLRNIQFQAISRAESPARLFEILHRTAQWPNWKKTQEPLLIRLASKPEWRYPALQGLSSFYLQQRLAEPLCLNEKLLLELKPTSREHRFRFASLALLTGQELSLADQVIENLHQEFPNDPATVYLRARQLLIAKKNEAALALIEPLPEKIRFSPQFALFTAQIYAADPRHAAAFQKALGLVNTPILMDAEQAVYVRLK